MAKLSDAEIDMLTSQTMRVAKATRHALREQGVRLTPEQFASMAGAVGARLTRIYLGLEPPDPTPRLN